MEYLVEFEAVLRRKTMPKGFPRTVHIREHYINVESDDHLKNIFNERFIKLVSQPGITVYLDGEPIDATLRFDQRKFIPWGSIALFHGNVHLITPKTGPRDLADPSLDPSNDTTDKPKVKTQ